MMRKITLPRTTESHGCKPVVRGLLLIAFIFIHFFSFSQTSGGIKGEAVNKAITVTLFYSPHCRSCFELKEEFLPLIKEKYEKKLFWQELNIEEGKDNFLMLNAVSARFAKNRAMTPSILVGDKLLSGIEEIKSNLEGAIEVALKEKASPLSFLKIDIADLFRKISVFTVVGSGLVDGINPCAFAVIVFFVSFLAVYGYRKKEIIYVGAAYCAAVFLTYLGIGLGLFNFLYTIAHFYFLIKVFYYFIAFFCFLLSVLSLYDYFTFKRKGQAEDLILQLPHFLKKRINITIGSKLRERKERTGFSLIVSSFVIGFFVSLLEAVCTGQIYLPTIVFILKNEDLRLKAISYLFLYNFMFILPLLIIFILSLAGFSSGRFNAFLKKNLGKIKILLALIFFALGILILYLQ